ncbi:MAG: hypothetical protein FJW85_08095 [Actinobacteria bacterium]|nr:hypothetical protein [Actinomycetota bacterium]
MSGHVSGVLPLVTVCDIDGVLADPGHRLHHVDGTSRDWEAFFAEAGQDPVIDEGREFVIQASSAGDAIVYLTGRPERLRAVTQAWLDHHRLPPGDLIMRGDDDRRPARVMKVQALRSIRRSRAIRDFLDDDSQVVSAAKAAGFAQALVPAWATRGL